MKIDGNGLSARVAEGRRKKWSAPLTKMLLFKGLTPIGSQGSLF